VLLFAGLAIGVLRNANVVTTRVDRDSAWMQLLDRGRLALEVNDPNSVEVDAAIALLTTTSADIAVEPSLGESAAALSRALDELAAALSTGVGQTEARTRVLRAIGEVETGIWGDHAQALAQQQRARVQLQWLAIVAVFLAGLAALAASMAHRRRLRAEELGRALEGALAAAENARRAADAASRAKSQFLATISHEIRTPMMAIVGMGELLDMTELDDRQRRYVATIDASSAALMALIAVVDGCSAGPDARPAARGSGGDVGRPDGSTGRRVGGPLRGGRPHLDLQGVRRSQLRRRRDGGGRRPGGSFRLGAHLSARDAAGPRLGG